MKPKHELELPVRDSQKGSRDELAHNQDQEQHNEWHRLPSAYQQRYEPVSKTISHDLDYRDANEHQASRECVPEFLSGVGWCCSPFRLLCPCCCWCEDCWCRGEPVLVQVTGSQALLEEWGRFVRVLQPGLHMLNPVSQGVRQVSLQTQSLEYSQLCISRDGVQFEARVSVLYRTVDPLRSAYRLGGNEREVIEEVATGCLRTIAGEHGLQEVVEGRREVSRLLAAQINHMIGYWGVYIELCALQDLQIDPAISNALSAAAVTRRKMEGMLAAAQGQVECALLYRQLAAQSTSGARQRIRYLNLVDQIIASGGKHTLLLRTEAGWEEEESL